MQQRHKNEYIRQQAESLSDGLKTGGDTLAQAAKQQKDPLFRTRKTCPTGSSVCCFRHPVYIVYFLIKTEYSQTKFVEILLLILFDR